MEEHIQKINFGDCTYVDEGNIWKFKNTGLSLSGKYEDENGTIRYFKNGKRHNENGPAYIEKDGYKIYYINGKTHRIDGPAVIYLNRDYYWYANGWHVYKETMNIWLKENDIPLDWNIWSNEDKMLFTLHWSDYNG